MKKPGSVEVDHRPSPDVGDPDRRHPLTRVAVLVALRPSSLGAEYDAVLHDLTRRAVDAVVAAGAEPCLLDLASDVPAAAEAVSRSDAVLVLGGADIDPALYGEQPHPLTVVGSRADDAYEIEAIRAAVDARTPVLAICRGLQLVNVAFGGTLLQDLGPDSAHHGPPDDLMVDTAIRPVEGTRFAGILGTEPLTVRTGNHQAIDRVADGLDGVGPGRGRRRRGGRARPGLACRCAVPPGGR